MRKNFTLIEVLIAAAILSIGIVGVLRSYLVLVDAVNRSRFNIEATALLKEKIMEIEQSAIEAGGTTALAEEGHFLGAGGFCWNLKIEELVLPIENLTRPLNKIELSVFDSTRPKLGEIKLVSYIEGIEVIVER